MTSTPETLAVATFNIRRCIGTDGRHDPERIATVIRDLDADVVALQEVDSAVSHPGRIDHLRYLASTTGLQPLSGPAHRRPYGDYGNAVLTRLPILDHRQHDLTVGAREPRTVLEAVLKSRLGALRILTTHLGLSRSERLLQMRRLVRILDTSFRTRAAIEVLAGDLNNAFRFSGLSRALHHSFGAMPAPRTFPARRPLLPLDRICVRPGGLLARLDAVRTPLTAVASDHLPLRAVLARARG